MQAVGASSLQQTEKQSDRCQSVTLEQTSDTLSYDSKDPLLSSVRTQCLSHGERSWTRCVQSYARKLGEFHRATLAASNPGNEHSNKNDNICGTRLLSTASAGLKEATQSVAKTAKGARKSSCSKNRKASAPFIEHQEDKRTRFSRSDFVNLQEHLSADEMRILSDLASALSLPDDVRRSLHAYLDRQKALDDSAEDEASDSGLHAYLDRQKALDDSAVDEASDSGSIAGDHAQSSPAVKRKTESKKQSVSRKTVAVTSSKPFWSAEDMHDPERLKVLLERTAKLLNSDKQVLLERAVERERLMKENAYHDKMASFVELCINTGMV